MNPIKINFVKDFYPIAKKASDQLMSQKGKFLAPEVYLTRAIIETMSGQKVKRNSYFGIKFGAGEKQLFTTTEYHNTKAIRYPKIISIVWDSLKRMYKYTIQDHFLAYKTPEESFIDFGNFLNRNPRYSSVFATQDSYLQTTRVATSGFATAPDSLKLSQTIHREVVKIISDLKLK
jgi:flagellum-specific peptidoglycan hydrolase FlgJ